MTTPNTLPPPLDFYNRPPKELAGFHKSSITNGGPLSAPTRPTSGESITLYAPPAGRGLALREQPAALTDFFQLNKVKFDASSFNAARIVVNVHRAGAPDASARLFYSPTGQAGSYIDAGVDLSNNVLPLVCTIDAIGVRTGSGPIAEAARGDVYWAVMWQDGDGVITPVLGAVFVQFMQKTFRACVWTVIVPPEDVVAPGETIMTDPQWTLVSEAGRDGFQSSCSPPTCLGWINLFRFGSGLSTNHYRHRTFSVLDYPELYEGRDVKITAEMAWTYAHFACGWEANPAYRLTLAVNGIVTTNVPSGFPPYDVSWLPIEIILPADGAGVDVAYGIFGDNGQCSVSVNGLIRNLQVEVLDDGVGGEDCI